ncbi:MAG: TMEM165/GDT1 family protein [Desulfobulbaceae bacterium]|nr:TMEM165/GDT1 family protein [Desulfobulbaceae bacterium]
MDLKVLLPVFLAVFLAELGDKTQLACVLFASDREANKLSIFIGASLALIVASAIGVYAGCLISEYFNEKQLRIAAGLGFIIMGIWTLLRH